MFISYVYLTDIMTQTVKVVDRKLVSPAGTATLVLNICSLHALTRCSLTLPEILNHIYSITVLTKVMLPSELRTFTTFKRWERTLILLFPMEITYIIPNNIEFTSFSIDRSLFISIWFWSASMRFGLVIIICWRFRRPIQASYQ